MDILSPIVYGFSTRADGNMSFNYGEAGEVCRNRQRFLKRYGIELSSCVAMKVEHSDRIKNIDRSDKGRGMRNAEDSIVADALVTKEEGVALFLITADCFPIIFYDPVLKVIALAHLGWRPTALNLTDSVVKHLHNELGSNPSDLHVIIGPGIHAKSYIHDQNRVQQGIHKIARGKNPSGLSLWQRYLKKAGEHRISIDLLGYNKALLSMAGVPTSQIYNQSEDTASSLRFFSHYRDKRVGERQGRFATTACIRTRESSGGEPKHLHRKHANH